MSGVYTAVAVGGAYLGSQASKKQSDAAKSAREQEYEMYQTGRSDLAPYRDFGSQYGINALKGLGNFQAPTMTDVYNSPTFALGQRAIENSAAARGGLLGGNFLRANQDYAGSLYNQEYTRKKGEYDSELAKLMGYTNLGYGAAGGSAGLAQNFGVNAGNAFLAQGNAQAQGYNDIGSTLAGAYGAYQGNQRWQDLLKYYNPSYGYTATPGTGSGSGGYSYAPD